MIQSAKDVKLSYEVAKILPSDDQTYIDYEDFKSEFGESMNTIVIAVQDVDFFDKDHLKAWNSFGEDIESIEGIDRVINITQLPILATDSIKQKFIYNSWYHSDMTESEVENAVELLKDQKIYKGKFYNKDANSGIMLVDINKKVLASPQRKNVIDRIIKKTNYQFEFIDLGGGMGISYNDNDKKLDYTKYNLAIKKFLKNHKSKIIFEPGRSIVGNTGTLISKIIYIKKSERKNFIILDAAMNDLLRPALYGSTHKILPSIKTNKKSKKIYEFVGPICESTDKFTTLKNFQELKEKDLVAMCDVGAYGMSLSSNYNVRPKPVELLIKGSKIKIIRKRQKHKDLM